MDSYHEGDLVTVLGEIVSENREHMSQIGKKAGETVSRDREHMSDIGREGGKQSHKNE
jgi:hypothetical protein